MINIFCAKCKMVLYNWGILEDVQKQSLYLSTHSCKENTEVPKRRSFITDVPQGKGIE